MIYCCAFFATEQRRPLHKVPRFFWMWNLRTVPDLVPPPAPENSLSGTAILPLQRTVRRIFAEVQNGLSCGAEATIRADQWYQPCPAAGMSRGLQLIGVVMTIGAAQAAAQLHAPAIEGRGGALDQ